MAFTYVTLQRTYETANDLPAAGTVTFTPVDQMRNALTVVSAPVSATLDSLGSISIRVAATTDPGTVPVGVTYRVTERIAGQATRTYYVSVPHDQGSTLQLADLTEVSGVGGGAGFALRNAADYDNTTPPSDGQVMTWDGTTSKFHPEAAAGGGAVSSVNGLTGAVTVTASGLGAQPVDSDLTAIAALAPADGALLSRQSGSWAGRTPSQVKSDLALDQVDNTSDAAKPVSTATATALAGKAAVGHTHAASGVSDTPVTMTADAGTVTPDAAQGAGPHRYDAASDVTLLTPVNGSDGQLLSVEIFATGGGWSLYVEGSTDPTTIPSGGAWTALLRFNQPHDRWLTLCESVTGAPSGTPAPDSAGLGLAPLGTSPLGG